MLQHAYFFFAFFFAFFTGAAFLVDFFAVALEALPLPPEKIFSQLLAYFSFEPTRTTLIAETLWDLERVV